jgi:hypothetical protein
MKFAPDIHNFSDVVKHCMDTLLEKGSLYKRNWDIYQHYYNKSKVLAKVVNMVDLLQYYQTYENKEASDFIRWLRTRDVLETSGESSSKLAQDPLRFAQILDVQLSGKGAGIDNEMMDVLRI